MDRTEQLVLDAAPAAVLAVVRDLGTYEGWLDLVQRAEPAGALDGDGDAAWEVELRAAVGPLARSKRLRMVRVQDDGRTVRFERREADGREHSPWVLVADVEPVEAGGSILTMRLHYGGGLYGPVLDKVLADAVGRGRSRLPAVVASAEPSP